MKASDDFFSGRRYAIFGAKAKGRMQGDVLITALTKAGKSSVAIQPDGEEVKGTEIARTLAEAGHVDGVVILPPAPWDESSADFTEYAVRQCAEQRTERVWIYTAGDATKAVDIAKSNGLDPVAGLCPCLYIEKCGFPHNFHRWIAKITKTL